MSLRSQLSVRQKLIWLILLASALSLLCVAVAALFYEATTFRPRAVERLRAEAGVLEEVLAAPLDFELKEAARKGLARHCVDRAIVLAALYHTHALFVSYQRDGAETPPPSVPAAPGREFKGRKLSLWWPVHNNEGVQIGHLYLLEELPPLYARLPQYTVMAGTVLLALTVVGLVIMRGVRRHVLGPLSSLVETTTRVTRDHDYGIRATVRRRDELGHLATAFNQMLEVIDHRDAALREASARIKSVFDATTEVTIVATDPQGLITVFNSGAERMLGYASEEIVGKANMTRLHKAEETSMRAAELSRQLGRTIEGFEIYVARARQGQPEAREWTYVRKDGTELQVHLVVTAVRNRQGDITGFLGVASDITRRKHTERMITQLAQLDRRLGAALDTRDAAQAVADVAENLLGWDACFVKLHSRDLADAHYALSIDTVAGRKVETPMAVTAAISPVEQRIMDEGPLLIHRDLSAGGPDPEPFGDVTRRSASLLYVPFRHQGYHMGVLSIQSYRANAYDSAALELLQTLADHAAGALERLHAEQALRESERNYREVFNASGDAILIYEMPSGRLVDVNAAMLKMYGFANREEALACPQSRLMAEEPPYTLAEAQERLRRATEEGPQLFDWIARAKDGKRFWVEVALRRSSIGGRVCVLNTVRNITERRTAQERIHQQAALLEASHDAILVWDVEEGIQFMNPAAEELTGILFARAQAQDLSTVLRPRSDLALRAAVQEVTAHGCWTGELSLLTDHDKPRDVASRWTVLADSSGKPKSVLITCNDITEKKRFEQQYLRAQRLESVGTLASGVAHDLNNILSPIMMGVEMLSMNPVDEETRNLLAMLKESAQRGRDTVKQLLTFARGTESQRGPVQPRHLLKEIVRLLQQTLPKNIQICSEGSEGVSPVLADPSQLHQVLMNLCVNARDAMPEGGVLFLALKNRTLDAATANVHPKARPIPYVMFEVSDSGTGIPPEVLERIFDPFFTTKPQGKGTGLGLATVLGIVEGHGGFVLVDSKTGRGTTFQVYIPASAAGEEDGREGGRGTLPRGRGELVLVVDDEPTILRLAEGVLGRGGYGTLTAGSASEALHLHEKNGDRIQAVLTDIMMPFSDGRQLITMLCQRCPNLPIIAMSGLATSEFQSESLKCGARAFVSKPFSAEQLLRALGDALQPPRR